MTENLSENDLIKQRRSKLEELRNLGNAYPNTFRRDSLSQDLKDQCEGLSKEDLEAKEMTVSVAGRIMGRRGMGISPFTIQLGSYCSDGINGMYWFYIKCIRTNVCTTNACSNNLGYRSSIRHNRRLYIFK